jgi:hypothetical protein
MSWRGILIESAISVCTLSIIAIYTTVMYSCVDSVGVVVGAGVRAGVGGMPEVKVNNMQVSCAIILTNSVFPKFPLEIQIICAIIK